MSEAQLPYVEPEDADAITKKIYEDAEARFKMILNIFKITGHAPEMATKMWDIFFEILAEGQMSWYDKELIILKATKMGDCLYCVTQHEIVSARLGVTEDQQRDIVGAIYQTSSHFKENEKALLDLTSHTVLDPEQIPADCWKNVKEHYDDGQIVEGVVTIGAYLQVSKFGDALGVQLEDAFTGHQTILFAVEPPKSPAAKEHLKHFQARTA